MKLVLLLLTASVFAFGQGTVKTEVQRLVEVADNEGEVQLAESKPGWQDWNDRTCGSYLRYNPYPEYVGVRRVGASVAASVLMGPGHLVDFRFLSANLVAIVSNTTRVPKAKFVWNADKTELKVLVTLSERDHRSLVSCMQ